MSSTLAAVGIGLMLVGLLVAVAESWASTRTTPTRGESTESGADADTTSTPAPETNDSPALTTDGGEP